MTIKERILTVVVVVLLLSIAATALAENTVPVTIKPPDNVSISIQCGDIVNIQHERGSRWATVTCLPFGEVDK